MKRDLAQHEEIYRLSLAKREGRVRVKDINYAEEATPHLSLSRRGEADILPVHEKDSAFPCFPERRSP
jgi:hypothetical protein